MSNSTICPSDKADIETTARLELRALQKMIVARCAQIERLVQDAGSTGALASRESDFQYQVFAERCARARAELQNDSDEPLETRAARLEQTLMSLECSWSYFGPVCENLPKPDDEQHWAIRVK